METNWFRRETERDDLFGHLIAAEDNGSLAEAVNTLSQEQMRLPEPGDPFVPALLKFRADWTGLEDMPAAIVEASPASVLSAHVRLAELGLLERAITGAPYQALKYHLDVVVEAGLFENVARLAPAVALEIAPWEVVTGGLFDEIATAAPAAAWQYASGNAVTSPIASDLVGAAPDAALTHAAGELRKYGLLELAATAAPLVALREASNELHAAGLLTQIANEHPETAVRHATALLAESGVLWGLAQRAPGAAFRSAVPYLTAEQVDTLRVLDPNQGEQYDRVLQYNRVRQYDRVPNDARLVGIGQSLTTKLNAWQSGGDFTEVGANSIPLENMFLPGPPSKEPEVGAQSIQPDNMSIPVPPSENAAKQRPITLVERPVEHKPGCLCRACR